MLQALDMEGGSVAAIGKDLFEALNFVDTWMLSTKY
jgi:hypothetical protein